MHLRRTITDRHKEEQFLKFVGLQPLTLHDLSLWNLSDVSLPSRLCGCSTACSLCDAPCAYGSALM